MTSVRKLVSQRRCEFLCRHLVDNTVTGLSLMCILQNLHYREHLLCCLESTKHDYIGWAAAEENRGWKSIGWCEDEARVKSKGEQYPLFKNNWPVDLAVWVSECFWDIPRSVLTNIQYRQAMEEKLDTKWVGEANLGLICLSHWSHGLFNSCPLNLMQLLLFELRNWNISAAWWQLSRLLAS